MQSKRFQYYIFMLLLNNVFLQFFHYYLLIYIWILSVEKTTATKRLGFV